MPGHSGHGDIATTPGLPKVEIERVVLDILIAGVVLAYRR